MRRPLTGPTYLGGAHVWVHQALAFWTLASPFSWAVVGRAAVTLDFVAQDLVLSYLDLEACPQVS